MRFKTDHRKFTVGLEAVKLQITDSGSIELEDDEQVTFKTKRGGEYDGVRQSWGCCATPSTDCRLPRFGLRAVIIKGRERYFVVLVEDGCEKLFRKYVKDHRYIIVLWLDREIVGKTIHV